MAFSVALAQLSALVGASVLVARSAKGLFSGTLSWVSAAAAFAACGVVVDGVPIAGYVRGHLGDLSVTTVMLLLISFYGPIASRQRRAVSVSVLVAAASLYPMALGLGMFDPYRLGYAPVALLGVVSGVAVFARLRGLDVLLLCVLGAVGGYALGVLESENLWDYLLDPWLTLFALYDLRPRGRNK